MQLRVSVVNMNQSWMDLQVGIQLLKKTQNKNKNKQISGSSVFYDSEGLYRTTVCSSLQIVNVYRQLYFISIPQGAFQYLVINSKRFANSDISASYFTQVFRARDLLKITNINPQ